MLNSPRHGPRVIAVTNQKGGVGKTTTAISLSAILAGEHRVLLIDLDPQANASVGLGNPARDGSGGTYAILLGESSLPDAVSATDLPNLRLLSGDSDLAGAELDLAATTKREFRLRHALLHDDWAGANLDYILIDCPPSLGLLTLNALVAADSVVIPLQCEFFALDGLRKIIATMDRVRRSLNPPLRLDGILLTMFDRRNSLSEQVESDVRSIFQSDVFETVIPRNVRISEAPSHGLPITLYDVRSSGAQAYIQFAQEFLRRERVRRMRP